MTITSKYGDVDYRNTNSAELYTCHLGGFVSNSAILPASMTNEILEKIIKL